MSKKTGQLRVRNLVQKIVIHYSQFIGQFSKKAFHNYCRLEKDRSASSRQKFFAEATGLLRFNIPLPPFEVSIIWMYPMNEKKN